MDRGFSFVSLSRSLPRHVSHYDHDEVNICFLFFFSSSFLLPWRSLLNNLPMMYKCLGTRADFNLDHHTARLFFFSISTLPRDPPRLSWQGLDKARNPPTHLWMDSSIGYAFGQKAVSSMMGQAVHPTVCAVLGSLGFNSSVFSQALYEGHRQVGERRRRLPPM